MTKRKNINLTTDEVEVLKSIKSRRSEPVSKVQRATILLMYNQGYKISQIKNHLNTTRPLIERVIDKALSIGAIASLSDLPRKGRPKKITDDAKAWVLNIACQRPADLCYAAELWSYSLLIRHIRNTCKQSGHSCLRNLGKGRLHSILSQSNIKPHKISYYVERRDENFEEKMANVLCVYKEVEVQNASNETHNKVTISFDEKPGIQAINNLSPQLQPVPEKYSTVSRDHQYKRLGTVSLLAGIDLHTGLVIPLVRERHRSLEFCEFIDILDKTYPPNWKIRLVLDNHSSHTSKETQKHLKTKPGRFEFVFTPKHGSWLNMIEMFFSKISRSFLRHMRVETKEELINRIYKGIDEINNAPVIFRWRYKMDEIAVA